MTEPLSADQEVCPTCGGSGHIEKVEVKLYEPGQAVVWYAGSQRLDATVIGYSKSGKRLRIKTSRWGSTFVSPLSVRRAL